MIGNRKMPMYCKLTVVGLLLCIQVFGQRQLYFSMVVKPENKLDEKIIAKYDTATVMFFKSYLTKPKSGFYPSIFSIPRYHVMHTVEEYNYSNKGFKTNEHEIFGVWNYEFNQLSIYGFAGLDSFNLSDYSLSQNDYLFSEVTYRYALDGNRDSAPILYFSDYKNILPQADFDLLFHLISKRVEQKLNLKWVNDSLLLSEHYLQLDTTILPQVFLHPIVELLLNNYDNKRPYGNNSLSIKLPLDVVSKLGAQMDTLQIPDLNNPLILLDTVVYSKGFPYKLSTTYQWSYTEVSEYNSTIPFLKRVPYSIGVHFKNGDNIYFNYNDCITLLKLYNMPANAFEQCLEAVFFKQMDFGLHRKLWIKNN